ncbi:methyl-accepting chemotaxis protein [Lyngbya sp. PCC 8106]|uniref:methyl-accepting chemotaxis protein n=1 Tax=Lyngbya sp. (strain PCC 8106) TaxID=313612 RepID=UPI0000EAC7D7|nr:methyl-accepting chemotaxis protein [Lyngbya sp. PCC 8106]EAW38783.1 putative methyl-accepting chemotaxis protein [Lyngbya sp. PCC 8106]
MLIFKRLRYGIIFGYFIPIVLFFIASLIVSINIKKIQDKQEILNTSNQVSESIGHLAIEINQMSIALQNHLLDPQAIYLSQYQNAQDQYQNIAQSLEEISWQEQQINNLQLLTQQVLKKKELEQQIIQLLNQNNSEQALQAWKDLKYLDINQEISALIRRIDQQEQETVQVETQLQEQAFNHVIWMTWVVTGVSLLLSVILGGWIITQIIRKLESEASAIASATTEIATTVAQQEQVAVQQAASVNQTTTSIDELGVSARQSAEQATAAAEGATQVLILAGGNHQTNSERWEEKTNLKTKMSQIQNQIIRLSENINQIYNITNLVTDLANQTNILALNASVEAVRAGEHGKGFGVVASEIRKLADQSRTSAQKIGVLISEIQKETNSTILVTEEGSKAVTEIGIAINEVTVNVQQISLNVQQQAIAIEQIVEAMNSLNIGIQESTNGISQTKISTQLLNKTANNLKEIV